MRTYLPSIAVKVFILCSVRSMYPTSLQVITFFSNSRDDSCFLSELLVGALLKRFNKSSSVPNFSGLLLPSIPSHKFCRLPKGAEQGSQTVLSIRSCTFSSEADLISDRAKPSNLFSFLLIRLSCPYPLDFCSIGNGLALTGKLPNACEAATKHSPPNCNRKKLSMK